MLGLFVLRPVSMLWPSMLRHCSQETAQDGIAHLSDNAAYADMTTTPISDHANNTQHDDQRCIIIV
ncbi:hypothetical protein BJL95_00315 [Methylomonas sp. LWB]|nr:hypothetical protein BJL95_00315 [Methylomonas sp. LWB]